MPVRGWVYVLTNHAMPGLVKVGYSTKDPVLRAEELNGTGLPHRFIVAYDVLVIEPREVEREIHEELFMYHEAKEFFRASVTLAVRTIDAVIARQGKEILLKKRYDGFDGKDWSSRAMYKVVCPECKRRDSVVTSTFLCRGCGKVFRSDMCLCR